MNMIRSSESEETVDKKPCTTLQRPRRPSRPTPVVFRGQAAKQPGEFWKIWWVKLAAFRAPSGWTSTAAAGLTFCADTAWWPRASPAGAHVTAAVGALHRPGRRQRLPDGKDRPLRRVRGRMWACLKRRMTPHHRPTGRPGHGQHRAGPAMTKEECLQAIAAGEEMSGKWWNAATG
jgi:hypothetical protein